MANKRARAELARAAMRFRRSRGGDPRTDLPALVLLTDDMRPGDPLAAIRALPRGSLVVLRARDPVRRAKLAIAIAGIARWKDIRWIVAGDPELAARTRADGVHFPEWALCEALHWRARRPGWLITCAAHALQTCARAARAGVDAVFVSPVLATPSHPATVPLGPLRLRHMARLSPVPVYALGGIDAATVARLRDAPIAGIAAIGGLAA